MENYFDSSSIFVTFCTIFEKSRGRSLILKAEFVIHAENDLKVTHQMRRKFKPRKNNRSELSPLNILVVKS